MVVGGVLVRGSGGVLVCGRGGVLVRGSGWCTGAWYWVVYWCVVVGGVLTGAW